jgi:hypothetical protein
MRATKKTGFETVKDCGYYLLISSGEGFKKV